MSDRRLDRIAGFIELGTVDGAPQLLDVQHGTHVTSTYAARTLAGVAKLPAAQRQAIYHYARVGYTEINNSLRLGQPNPIAKALKAAISAAGSEIAPGTLLSRKIKVHGSAKEQLLNATGKVVQEPAVMSTSTDPDMYTGTVHLKLTVGNGVKGIFLGWGTAPGLAPGSAPDSGSISRTPGESELMLPPNTRLYIHKVTEAPHRGDRDGFGGESDLTHIVHAVILPTQ